MNFICFKVGDRAMYCGSLSFTTGPNFLRGIQTLRDLIRYGRERSPNDPLRVELHAPLTPNKFIYAYLNSSDLYVTSVQSADGTVFVFRDMAHPKMIANQKLFGFGGHYSELGDYASLGQVTSGSIDAAIASLSGWAVDTKITSKVKSTVKLVQGPVARQLLHIILVTAESIRFTEIPKIIANALDGYRAGPDKLEKIDRLVNQWSYLSGLTDGRVAILHNP